MRIEDQEHMCFDIIVPKERISPPNLTWISGLMHGVKALPWSIKKYFLMIEVFIYINWINILTPMKPIVVGKVGVGNYNFVCYTKPAIVLNAWK